MFFSPRINEGTPPTLAGERGGDGTQTLHNPAPCVQRVNDIVDFHVGRHVDSLPSLVGGIDHRFKGGLAFLRVADRREFFAIAQAHGSLQTHRAKLSTGPGDGEEGSMEAAAGHCLRPQSVPFAYYDREQRHADAACRHKHARNVPDERGPLRLRPDHEAGGVTQGKDGQAESVAQLHEARCFVGGVRVDRAAQVQRVVGDHAQWAPLNSDQGRDDTGTKLAAQFQR